MPAELYDDDDGGDAKDIFSSPTYVYICERYVSVHLFLLQLEYYRMQGVLEVRWTCDRHKQRIAFVTKNEKYILNCLIVLQWC